MRLRRTQGHDNMLHRKRDLLRQLPVFRGMEMAQFQRLAICSKVVCRRAGDVVCQVPALRPTAPSEQTHPQNSRYTPRCPSVVV